MLDFGFLEGDIIKVPQLVMSIPLFDRWRNVILSGGSIPRSNKKYREGIDYQPRHEWKAFKKLMAHDAKLFQNVIVSDSGTRPFVHDVHSENRRGVPNIKYTGSDLTVVLKGKFNKTGSPVPELQSLAKELTGMNEIYDGSEFSAGDEFFQKSSMALRPIGKRQSWIEAELNHHMTKLITDINDLRSQYAIAA